MRVVLVTPRFAPEIGGVETHVAQLAGELAHQGLEVVVITSAPRGGVAQENGGGNGRGYEIRRAVRPRGVPAELGVRGVGRLVREAVREAPGEVVVHTHSYHGLAAAVAARAAGEGTTVVLTGHYHGTGHSPLRRVAHLLYRPVGRWMMRRAAAVVAVTEAEAALVRRDFPTETAGKIHVIPNGARRWARAEHTGRAYVLTVSRLEAYKRTDTLVQAATGDGETGFELVVAGDGTDRERLEAIAAGDPRVRFAGRVSEDELAELWSGAAVYASASEQEAFGLGVAEALASGVAVVASQIPAHVELVERAGRGTLVAGHDPAQWRAALSEAMLGQSGGAALAGWDEVGAAIAELYRDLLGGHR